MVPTMRLRGRTSDPGLGKKKDDIKVTKRGPELFSDDDDDDDGNTLNPSSSASNEKTSITSTTVDPRNLSDLKNAREVSFALPRNHVEGDDEEVDADLEMLSKAIHITNIDEIDHVGLMRTMYERFKKKEEKWRYYASVYSKWSFSLNFFILVMQIVQILFHQMAEIFGISSSFSQALRCLLAAITALVTGLQMKLKLTEKSEKYRRGAKVYARLHRVSTYYLMLVENGGKIDDVTGLWREAMKKEGKWIPAVRTYMAT